MRILAPVALAAALLTTAALSGCTLLAPPSPATSAAPTTVEGYYAQTLDWEDCEPAGMECTTVSAPIDWADASAGSIELAVVRLATKTDADTRVGSLLMNPGGPGGSGVELVQQAAEFVTSDELRANFDIVGWDPRGVGASTPVDCYDDAEMDEFLYGVPKNPTGTDAWLADQVDVEADFAAA